MYAGEAVPQTAFASPQQDMWRQQQSMPQSVATTVESAANYSPIATMSRSMIHPAMAAAASTASPLSSPAKYQRMPPQMLPQNSLDDGDISELLLEGSFSQDSATDNSSNIQETVDFSNIFDPIGDNSLSSDAELSRLLCRLLD